MRLTPSPRLPAPQPVIELERAALDPALGQAVARDAPDRDAGERDLALIRGQVEHAVVAAAGDPAGDDAVARCIGDDLQVLVGGAGHQLLHRGDPGFEVVPAFDDLAGRGDAVVRRHQLVDGGEVVGWRPDSAEELAGQMLGALLRIGHALALFRNGIS